MLLDASRFCSLGCKLAAVPKDFTLTFIPRVASASGGHGAGCNGANAAKRASATGPATSHRANGYNAAAAGGNVDTWREDNGNSNASAAWVQKARTTGKKRVTPEVNTATSSPEVSLLAASMEYDNIEDSFGGADSGRILVADDDDDRLLVERDVDERFLKTKAIRDLEQQQRKAQFKQAIIRVRFPDNTVVEAAFAPTDAVAAVRQFVRKCLLQPDLPFFF
ncbi:unnamed protein product, partial [Closterium sp. Naga37s-1]